MPGSRAPGRGRSGGRGRRSHGDRQNDFRCGTYSGSDDRRLHDQVGNVTDRPKSVTEGSSPVRPLACSNNGPPPERRIWTPGRDNGHVREKIRQQDEVDHIEALKQIMNKDSTGIIIDLVSPKSPLNKLLDDSKLDLRHIKVILRVLAKACTGSYEHSIQLTLRRFITNQTFLANLLPTYLTTWDQIDSKEEFQQAGFDLLIILQQCFNRLPRKFPLKNMQCFRKLVDFLAKVQKNKESHLVNSLYKTLQEIDQSPSSADERSFPKRHAKQSDFLGNFRNIPLVPSPKDLGWHRDQVLRFLKPQRVRGKYDSVDEYLQTQFYLLREDFVGPFRQVIEGDNCKKMATAERIAGGHRYNDAVLLDPHYSLWGPRNWLKISSLPEKIDWENTQRLRPGNLVYLRHRDIKSLVFAKIIERDISNVHSERQCNILIQLEGDYNHELPDGKYTVVETDSFYEAYCHVLKVLQSMTEENMPLKDCIVDVNKNVGPPEYLKDFTQYCLAPLKKVTFTQGELPVSVHKHGPSDSPSASISAECLSCSKKKGREKGKLSHFDQSAKLFPVLNPETWPSAEELDLDPSQLEALQLGLTKKVALIQGPPGTGKTHVGLKIIRALLHNMSHWSFDNDQVDEPVKTPILVVCFTNHALDQFLEGVLAFTEKVLRVGGRCESRKLQPYTLNMIKQAVRTPNARSVHFRNHMAELISSEDEEDIIDEGDDSSDSDSRQTLPRSNEIEKEDILVEALEKAWLLLGGEIKRALPDYDIYKEVEKEARYIERLKHKLQYGKQNFIPLKDIKDVMGEKHYSALKSPDCVPDAPDRVPDAPDLLPDAPDLLPEWLFLTRKHIKEYDINPELKHLMRKGMASAAQAARKNACSNRSPLKQPPSEHSSDLDTIVRELIGGIASTDEDEREVIMHLAATGQTDMLEELYSLRSGSVPVGILHTSGNDDDEDRDTEVQTGWTITYNVRDFEKYQEAVSNRMCQVCKPMSEQEVAQVQDVWKLKIVERWQLYNWWRSVALNHMQDLFERIKKDYLNDVTAILELNCESNYSLAKSADVVGMTTTGAAKNRQLILRMRPKVVFVEEAAEVLEAHITATLVPSVQHLILIGDHKQLRPTPTMHQLVRKHHLDVSLFERLVKNRMPSQQLTIQHRMRPCVTSLLVPAIYPVLENHPSVNAYESIRGMGKSVFFFTHSQEESSFGVSKTNKQEAAFLVGLCKHLLRQGYGQEQITILAAYSKQMELIQKLVNVEFAKKQEEDKIKSLRVTSIDNYQGEENDIILLSFVRSNQEGKIGFLKTENRVCVALSRVKKGLYAVGNFEFFAKQSEELYEFWYVVKARLEYDNMIGSSATIFCHRHPDKSLQVSVETPLKCWDEGICQEACRSVLNCGHLCPRRCHHDDPNHVQFRCQEPCDRKCPSGHPCLELCHMPCSCKQLVTRILATCGHMVHIECSTPLEQYQCTVEVDKKFSCGHSQLLPCYSRDKEQKCKVTVTLSFPCNHKTEVPCHKAKNVKNCEVLVDVTMQCGHVSHLPCCVADRASEQFCTAPTQVVLSCGHEATVACNRRESTPVKCTGNAKVKLPCGHEGEIPCGTKVQPQTVTCSTKVAILADCGHEVQVPCQEAKSGVLGSHSLRLRQWCAEPCRTELDCGHPCPGKCGTCSVVGVHELCAHPCDKILSCGHTCSSPCGVPCPPCGAPCERGCEHAKCSRSCGEPCVCCKRPCRWSCKHEKCTKQCHELCDRKPCEFPCKKLLPCQHPCYGFCGEPCPPLCIYCNPNSLPDCFLDEVPIQDPRLVLLEDCGHVIESRALRTWFGPFFEELAKGIGQALCPICFVPIRKNRRYGEVIRRNVNSINLTKFEGRERREKLLRKLDLLKEDFRSEHVRQLHDTMRQVAEKRNLGCLAETLIFFTYVLERVHDICAYILDRSPRDIKEVVGYLSLLLPVMKRLILQGTTPMHLVDLTWQISRLELLSALLTRDFRNETPAVKRVLAKARGICLCLPFGQKEYDAARKAIIELNKLLGYSAVPLKYRLRVPVEIFC